jgi:outer membrane PBP1 activator LpoA protein
MPRSATPAKSMRLAAALTITLLVSACAVPPQRPAGEAGAAQPSVALAQDSSAKGNYVIAAQSYLTLAQQSSGAEQQQYLLAAAAILTRGQHIQRASSIIAQIDPTLLPPHDRISYHFTRARIALLQLEPEQALSELRLPGNTVPLDLAGQWHSLRAEAYTMAGNYLEAVRERIMLEQTLSDADQIRRNHHDIWENLNQLSSDALQTLRSAPPPDVLTGWLELALIYKSAANDPQQLEQRIKEWLKDYPQHPAAGKFVGELLAYQDIQLDRPKHIALLLPLSGNFSAPARAVRDGFLAAYYNRDSARYSPEIRIYDTTDEVATGLEVYQRAVKEGADFIVGPLNKPLVEALAQQAHPVPSEEPSPLPPLPAEETQQAEPKPMAVPTLALNYWNDETMVAENFYQFGLLPEDEARQVAERAWLDGYNKALVLAPEGEWGERMYTTFVKHWQQLDGKVLEAQRYDPTRHDFSAPVIELLNIDQSRQRERKLERLTGLNLKFEPRRRQDVDFIYLAAFPNQARQIRPQLKFYYAANVPVYSSSHVYSGEQDPTLDRDMDGITFCDMPWVFSGGDDREPNWKLFTHIWHSNALPFKRLYAMGVDAYRLISHLKQMRDNPQAHFNADTGNLYLDSANRIHRQLLWARFRGGKPVLIDNNPPPQDGAS